MCGRGKASPAADVPFRSAHKGDPGIDSYAVEELETLHLLDSEGKLRRWGLDLALGLEFGFKKLRKHKIHDWKMENTNDVRLDSIGFYGLNVHIL